jgi:tetratricopeptide (TPR) repeat protein
MIEKAFVSGQIAQSIFQDDDQLFIINASDTDKVVDCTPYEKSLFFSSGTEIKVFKNISIEELRKELLKEKACFDAIYGAIGGFDNNLTEETRILSIERAESLVKDTEIFDFVKSRLFGNPVPAGSALKKAVRLSKRNGFHDMNFLYNKLLNYKDVIDRILFMFRETIFRLSLDRDFVKIKNIFITSGFFARLFLNTTDRNLKDLNKLVYDFSIDPKIREQIPSISQILNIIRTKLEHFYYLDKTVPTILLKLKQKRTQRYNIAELLNEFNEVEGFEKHKKKRFEKARKKRKIKVVMDGIESQIERVIKEAEKGNYHQVRKYSYQLLKYNLEHSRKEHVCKTLSKLASNLMKINRLDLAEEFINNALLLNTKDVFPKTIKIEVFKARGDYEGALTLCNETIGLFPQDVVPPTIKIEILKACGEYEEALRLCEETIERFPQDVVPRNIKSEILKARGEYNDALNFCNENIDLFPQEVVPRTIKTKILKTLGEYEEALNLCNEAIGLFPQEVVPRTIKIEILKALGEYNDALNLCNETIDLFPQEVVPRTIKTEILKARGEYDEALNLCNETIGLFPQEVVPRTIKTEILRTRGNYEEAMKLCEEMIERFPKDVVLHTIKIEILKARGDYEEALRQCEETIERFPKELVPCTIKIEILKACGDYEEALKLCEETIERFPQEVVPRNIKSEILKSRGDYEDALKLCEETIERFPQEVVPRNIKSEILKSRGDYESALKFCNVTIKEFPANTVTKNVKLSILLLIGKLKESDFSVLGKIPKTDDDFIEYHILGMFHLKSGNIEKAIKIFEYGIGNANLFDSRNYFLSALCVAKIRQKKYREPIKLLSENENKLKTNQLNQLILVHSTAEIGDIREAEKIACNLNAKEVHLNNLKNGLISRYELNCGYPPPLSHNVQTLDKIIMGEEEFLLAAYYDSESSVT